MPQAVQMRLVLFCMVSMDMSGKTDTLVDVYDDHLEWRDVKQNLEILQETIIKVIESLYELSAKGYVQVFQTVRIAVPAVVREL